MRSDMSFVKDNVAVNCRTYEEATDFINLVTREIPCVRESLLLKLGRWDYEADEYGLAFRVTKIGKDSYDTGYCTADWYRRNFYKVLEFRDIFCDVDLGSFESGFVNKSEAFAAIF